MAAIISPHPNSFIDSNSLMTVGEMLEAQKMLRPDKLAVSDARRSLTYAQLFDRCVTLAGSARDRWGAGRGERIAIVAPNLIEHAELLGACTLSGAICVPINCSFSAAEIAATLVDTTPRAPVVRQRRLPRCLRPETMPQERKRTRGVGTRTLSHTHTGTYGFCLRSQWLPCERTLRGTLGRQPRTLWATQPL
jgi:acyl-coenzyme A synthetase/AMP-(fatty) acid ligase